MKHFIALLVVVLLVSCVSPRTVYVGGTSELDQKKDAYECKKEIRMMVTQARGSLISAGQARSFMTECMESKGYHARQVQD